MVYNPDARYAHKRSMLNLSYSQQRRFHYLMLGALLLIATIIFAFPFYWLLISSLKSRDQIFSDTMQFIPDPLIWQNFKNIFRETQIQRAFFNSATIAAGNVLLTLFFCSLAGFAFAKYRNAPGHNVLFAMVMGTMMIPGAVTMIPVFLVLTKLHMINSYWALIIPGAANAFGIFLMRQYIASFVPDDLLAAARIDGCSEFGIYWRIVLPISIPPLAALGIFALIGSWNNLMSAFIFMRTEDMYTLPLWVYIMQGDQTRIDYGIVMAGGLITALPLIIAFLFFQRGFIQGMTSGAMKQ
ncbi:carbohydrate ABC transporter permease [Candidatus Sumerlaeota bacterium]|nr:carbohydrate ABC transporter permease [Candidatus Sumerlaeota bacterium]